MTDKSDERKALEALVGSVDYETLSITNVPRFRHALFSAKAVLATAPAEPPHAEDRIERAVLIKQLRDAADALEYADGYIEGALEVIDAYAEEKAATPSRLASGPSQEGADGSAAAPPTAPAEPPKDGEVAALIERLRARKWEPWCREAADALARLSAPVPARERYLCPFCLRSSEIAPPPAADK